MYKTNSLEKLKLKGLNIHKYELIETIEEYIKWDKENPIHTIRFDSYDLKYNLPFYIMENGILSINSKQVKVEEMFNKANEMNCGLLCSNGHKYDESQICNYVYKLNNDNTFLLEISFEKVTLREMYNYETVYISGNLYDELKVFNTNNIKQLYTNKTFIEKILVEMIKTNIRNTYCECTYYKVPVGILHKNIIYWQI